MAYEMNDLKGILFLVLFAIPIISSANINCSGKAFHCVNSTHFRICVDLGGGVSTTIDDFVIPCPPGTECHLQNIFECDFPKIETTTEFNVIGVSLQSDTSVTSSVINSETASTLPIDSPSVISSKENVTGTTFLVPEEVTSTPKSDILESLTQHSKVKNYNSTDAVSNTKVTSSSIHSGIVEQTNQNTITNTDYHINNTNNSESILENSIDKAITASFLDIFTPKDTINSVRGLLNLISNNPQSVTNTSSFSDVSTALNTSYEYNVSTTDKYVITQVIKGDNKTNNVANDFNKPTENIVNKVYDSTDEISTTPMVNMQTQSQSSDADSRNKHNNSLPHPQNVREQITVGEMTTIEQKAERKIDIFNNEMNKRLTIEFLHQQTNSANQKLPEHNATGEITTSDQIAETRTKINTTSKINLQTQRLNTVYINNQTNSVNQNITELRATDEIITSIQIPERITETNTTSRINEQTQSININSINNQAISVNQNLEQNVIAEITTTEQMFETRIEINTTPTINVQTQSLNIDDINNQTRLVHQNLAKQNASDEITTTDQIIEIRTEINTTPMAYLYNQHLLIDIKNNQTDSVNQNITERNVTVVLTTTDQIPETATNYLDFDIINATPEPEIISLVTERIILNTTEAAYYTTLNQSIGNDSIVVEKASILYPLEISATTDTPIVFVNTLITKNNAEEHNNTIERLESTYEASSSDLFVEKVTESTQFRTSIIDTTASEIMTTENLYTTDKVINKLPPSSTPFSIKKKSQTNVTTETVINISTTSTPYNTTMNFNRNITDITPETFVRNTPDNYTSINHGTTENVRSYLENKYVGVINQQYGTEAVTLPDKVNIDQTTKNVQGVVGKTTIYTNVKDIGTTYDPSETTISEAALALKNSNFRYSVNSINQNYNSTRVSNTETTQSEVPETKLPQSPPLDQYVTGFTTQMPEIIHETTMSMDSVRKVPNNVNISITSYKVEMNTVSPLDVTHDNNIEVGTDHVLTISTQEPAGIDTMINRNEEIDSLKQVTMTWITTETINDIIPSTVTTTNINENVTNFNTLHHSTMSTVDHNKEVIKTTIINKVNGLNIEATTQDSRPVNDDNIETVIPFDTTDLTANMLTNGSMKLSILNNQLNTKENNKTNPLLFDGNNAGTTTSQVLRPSMSAIMYNATNEISKVKQLVLNQLESLPKNSTLHQNLSNLEISSSRSPIKDMHTENVEGTRIVSSTGIDTETPTSSTIKYNAINLTSTHTDDTVPEEDTKIFMKGMATDYSKLPDVGIGKDKHFNGNTPASVGSLDGVTETTAHATSSTQITSQLVMHEEINSNKLQIVTELPLVTTGVIETQTVYHNAPNYSSQILENAQMTTESALLFSQSTLAPIAKTMRDNDETFIPTEMPQYRISIENTFDPLFFTDVTTETVINSVTDPDSLVETIRVNQDKVSGTNHLESNIFGEIMFQNQTVNNFSYNDIPEKNNDHANIVIEFDFQNSTQNITTNNTNSLDLNNREDMILETENNTMQTDILTDSDKNSTFKITDFSIDRKSTTKSSTLKSDIYIPNKVLPIDLWLTTQIDRKEDQAIDIDEPGPTGVTTGWSSVTNNRSVSPQYFTQTNDIITNDNVNINNSIKINLYKSDIKPNKLHEVDSGNISHIDNIKNVTMSHSNLTQQDSTFSDNLEQQLKSTNHTITSDILSHLNESAKRSNQTNNELKIRDITINNLNSSTANIKINVNTKDKITINATASTFDCSNHTRGKYADKNDCRKFYTCIGKLQPLVGICPNNTVFSEINKQCTRNLSHCVRNNQFRCLFEGRFNDFFKDNIYYICVKNSMNTFVRYKLQCLSNYHLNKISVRCEKNVEKPSQSASSISENSKINNDESIPEIKSKESKKTNTTLEFHCENEGQFPHTKDCNKYYICTKIKDVYRRKIKKCASEEIYNKEKKKCVETDSGEC